MREGNNLHKIKKNEIEREKRIAMKGMITKQKTQKLKINTTITIILQKKFFLIYIYLSNI